MNSARFSRKRNAVILIPCEMVQLFVLKILSLSSYREKQIYLFSQVKTKMSQLVTMIITAKYSQAQNQQIYKYIILQARFPNLMTRGAIFRSAPFCPFRLFCPFRGFEIGYFVGCISFSAFSDKLIGG